MTTDTPSTLPIRDRVAAGASRGGLARAVRSLGPSFLPTVALAALVSGMVGWVGAEGPQPLTDAILASGHVEALSGDQVLLVTMDNATSLADWEAAIDVVEGAGASHVAAVNPPGPLDVLTLERGDVRGVGLAPDWDGVTRRWSMGTAAHPTLPGQLADAMGRSGRGERLIAVGGQSVPMVGVDNLAYLDPAALSGRTVVLGETTPWAVPLVDTAAGPMTLAEVLTRTAAAPQHLPAPRAASAVLGLFGGGLAAAMLLATTRRRRWAVLAPVAGILAAVPFAVGVLVPFELPLIAMLTGLLSASSIRWVTHSARFKALVDRAIWQLHVEPHTEDLERDWQELCTNAVDLGVATRVWAVEAVGGTMKTVAAADIAGELTLSNDVPPPFADPIVVELSSSCGRQGVLLIDAPTADPDLRPLYAAAAHQARKKRVAAPRLENVEAYISVGVAIVHAAFDALLSDAKMIQSSARAGAHARAIFDPLGRMVNADQRLESVLFPQGRGAAPKLMDLWTVVGGTRGQVTDVMNGEGTVRLPHVSGCLLLLSVSHDHGRLVGFVVELVDGEVAARRGGMLGPRLVSDGGRRVERSA